RMFRKPAKKGNTRQRVVSDHENDEGAELTEITATGMEPPKPRAIVSFDDAEGADDNFEIKKSKRYQKEQRRQKKLEERAAREIKEEEEDMDEQGIAPVIYMKQEIVEEKPKESGLRATSYKKEVVDDYVDEEEENVGRPHPPIGEIPDSRAVYEAKKKREEMRRKGKTSDYIALDEDKKLSNKGERRRLIREEDDDDSDNDVQTFYSAKSERREEEERRRNAHYDMLEGEEDRENEMDEWERMQIEKAVSTRNVGEMKERQMHEEFMMEQYNMRYGDNKEEVEMEVDVADEVIVRGGINNSDPISISSMLDKLKLRMEDREENLNRRRYEVSNLEKTIIENDEDMERLRSEGPKVKEKHEMLQRMRVYSMCVLECLDEKMEMVNELVDARRKVNAERRDRIEKRRRRDVKDYYEECSAVASGRDVIRLRVGEHQQRYSDREGRKGKRRREREGKVTGMSHEEGMSSDDEEVTSQVVNDKETLDGIGTKIVSVFSDTLPEYSSLKGIIERILEWLWIDPKSFNDSYVGLCIPKLSSHFVRLQLSLYDPLRSDLILSEMDWYRDVLSISSPSNESTNNEVVISLIPSIIHKVVIPYLTDVISEEWEPVSLSQSTRISTLVRTILTETPSLDQRSKPLRRLLQTIIERFNNAMDEDLFVPMFSRVSMDNPQTGCRSFLDRQFWSAIKLINCVSAFTGVLSDGILSQLCLSISNRVCVIALQLVDMNEPHVIMKTRALLSSVRRWIGEGRVNELRPLLTCMANVQKCHGEHKDLMRDTQSVIEEIRLRI
ncbi:hypothetical protein PENTCL1PPCAC_22876, partial [Pristionchus entomophagus]